MKNEIAILDSSGQPMAAVGGAYEAANRLNRETALWHAPSISADRAVLANKEQLDAKAKDMTRNEGYALGAVATHRDSIVGGEYRLNARPDYKALGADEAWAEEFQAVVESQFSLWAESPDCWPDAARQATFTGLVRLAVSSFALTGEYLATGEWLRDSGRPANTAIKMVNLDRLCNPNDAADTEYLRRGVEVNMFGAPQAYYIRNGHRNDTWLGAGSYTWSRIPAAKPWGRAMVLHYFEPWDIEQSRGVSDIVSVLKDMRMLQKFRDVNLQNAVVNATYAAVIESELPSDVLYAQLGEGDSKMLTTYMGALSEYVAGSRNLAIDGVKIPHLFPGTKFNMQRAGDPGGLGSDFEQSLMRHLAAPFGLSYEEFSRDFTKTNYSSARAGMAQTHRFMQSRKRLAADRFANSVYRLRLEEMINKGEVPMPRGKTAAHFYEGLNKEAYCRATWIGASRGQIDELKETQAAVLRINAGLSTLEIECARLGEDFREILNQQAREMKMKKSLGLTMDLNPNKPSAMKQAQSNASQKQDDDEAQDTGEAVAAALMQQAVAGMHQVPVDDGL